MLGCLKILLKGNKRISSLFLKMTCVFHLVWVRLLHDSKDFYLVWATAGLCKLSYLELEPLGVGTKDHLSMEWSFSLSSLFFSLCCHWRITAVSKLVSWPLNTLSHILPLQKKLKFLNSSQNILLKIELCSCHYPTQNHSVTWSRSSALIRTSATWPSLFLQPSSCRITHLARPVNSVALLGASLTLSSFDT